MGKIDRNRTPLVHGSLHQANYGGWWFEGQNDALIYWADEVDALLKNMRGELAAKEQKAKWVLAQIRKIVSEKQRLFDGPSVAYDNGYKTACADILAQIRTIGKRKKTRLNRR